MNYADRKDLPIKPSDKALWHKAFNLTKNKKYHSGLALLIKTLLIQKSTEHIMKEIGSC